MKKLKGLIAAPYTSMNTDGAICEKSKKMKYIQILLGVLVILAFTNSCGTGILESELITTKVFNYPVLKGKDHNPILRIAVDSQSPEDVVNALSINLTSTFENDLKELHVFYTGKDSTYNNEVQFGKSVRAHGNNRIQGMQALQHGKNYFWVTCSLNEDAKLDSKLSIALASLDLNGQKYSPATTHGVKDLRTGVAVRKHKDDDVHTYRIPGLATTNKGTLLAIYDVRYESGRDLQGHIDIGLSRSIDGGNSWEPMRIVLDKGEWGGLPQKFNGVSDACVLVDKNSDAIYIAGLWMHGVINSEGEWLDGLNEESKDWNHQWRDKGSQPGLGVQQTSQFLITKSTDDGQTWSEPINLTAMCKKPEWWLWAPAPGHGITLDNGTLVFPTQGRDEHGETFSNITFSRDGGKSWTTSNPAYQNTTESMAVQLSDGSVMLNMRDNRNRQEKGEKNGRAIAITDDLGETWMEHHTSHGALIEPVCMASIHKHFFTNDEGVKKSVLFFSNPNSKFERHKQTIKVSFDEGKSWPEKYWIELDEGTGAGYSCLTSIDENTIGILYEGSQAHMTFQALDLSEILKKGVENQLLLCPE